MSFENIKEDILTAKKNFIPLLIGVLLFTFLLLQANTFTNKYGSEFKFTNIFQEGYLTGTLLVLFMVATAISAFIFTIGLAIKNINATFSWTALAQILIAIVLTICSLVISTVPFLITLAFLGLATLVVYQLANE